VDEPGAQGKPVGLTPIRRAEVTHDAPTQDIPEGFDIRRVKTNPPPDDDVPFWARWWGRILRMFGRR
jgi:hypothetical protein